MLSSAGTEPASNPTIYDYVAHDKPKTIFEKTTLGSPAVLTAVAVISIDKPIKRMTFNDSSLFESSR
jgi:hypothetical protein